MRIKTLLRELLGLEDTLVVDVAFDEEGLVVDVRPRWRRPRCSQCGKACGSYDRERGRTWRHQDLAGMVFKVRHDTRRANCPDCGVHVERVPWAETGSWFTRAFEDQLAYLAQRCDQTTVGRQMRVAWETVGNVIQRVMARHQTGDLLEGLKIIGVDELSYRRHHEYVTVVVDHIAGRIVWARPGKNADTLKAFFVQLGAERCAKLEAVTIDMSGAYIKAVTEATPEAKLIFDRFHVQRLAQDALDEVRRAEVRDAVAEDKAELKNTRWALLKNPWNLSRVEREKLSTLPAVNLRLYRAYLLKEALAAVLDSRQINVATRKLDEWISWARRSRLGPFKKLAETIKKHATGILAYVSSRLSNGRTEGLNGKARTITRRAYGFHSASSLIAMLFLCCSGIHLNPVFNTPKTAKTTH